VRFGDLSAVLEWFLTSITTQKKGLTHPRPALCDAEGPGLEQLLEQWLVTVRTHPGTFGYTPYLVEWSFY
jgi:hypothetical protein